MAYPCEIETANGCHRETGTRFHRADSGARAPAVAVTESPAAAGHLPLARLIPGKRCAGPGLCDIPETTACVFEIRARRRAPRLPGPLRPAVGSGQPGSGCAGGPI